MEPPAGLFGALEVAQRLYDLRCEVEDYLKEYPKAAVVNLGCGLDDTFSKVDNGKCRGYNLYFPDVIKVRNELLPAGDREKNIACDLNDYSWMDAVDASNGAVFFAAGVFYYFKTEAVKRLEMLQFWISMRRFRKACIRTRTALCSFRWCEDELNTVVEIHSALCYTWLIINALV